MPSSWSARTPPACSTACTASAAHSAICTWSRARSAGALGPEHRGAERGALRRRRTAGRRRPAARAGRARSRRTSAASIPSSEVPDISPTISDGALHQARLHRRRVAEDAAEPALACGDAPLRLRAVHAGAHHDDGGARRCRPRRRAPRAPPRAARRPPPSRSARRGPPASGSGPGGPPSGCRRSCRSGSSRRW